MGLFVFHTLFFPLSFLFWHSIPVHPFRLHPRNTPSSSSFHPTFSHTHSFHLSVRCSLITSFPICTLINCHQLENERNIKPHPEDEIEYHPPLCPTQCVARTSVRSRWPGCCRERATLSFQWFQQKLYFSPRLATRATRFSFGMCKKKKKIRDDGSLPGVVPELAIPGFF